MINIDDKTRRLSQATIVVGYKQENKAESIEFKIPDYLKEYGKKICFKTKDGKVFSKLFDNTTSNIFTFTRTETQYGELDATIQFFKTQNKDMIVYKTSMLHIIFNETINCEDEVQPDEPKIPILESLIERVTDLNNTITENEETRNNNENTRISNENERKTNEKERETYYTNIQNKVNNGEFNGATYLPNVDAEGNISWTNNKGLENPSSQNIRGPQGVQGPQGEAFKIKKTYPSVEAMQNDFDNMKVGDYVMIATSIELEDNAKLYARAETEWVFITDFSGAQGIQGPQGIQGIQGVQGERGIGISKLEVKQGYLYVTLTDNATQNAGLIITDEVKQWLVNEITNNAQSNFNTYYNGKVTDFNNYATTKIQEYDTNAQNKITEYDEHAEELTNRITTLENEKTELQLECKRLREDNQAIAIIGQASGENITLNDSSDARFKKFVIGGNSWQETGDVTDEEGNVIGTMPSTEYKSDIRNCGDNVNLIELKDGTVTVNGITATIKNEEIILNGTATASTWISFAPNLKNGTTSIGEALFDVKSDSDYTVSAIKTNGNVSGDGLLSLTTITDNGQKAFDMIKANSITLNLSKTNKIHGIWLLILNGFSFTDYKFKVKIEKGTKATPYSKYNCGNANVTICNKNLSLLDFRNSYSVDTVLTNVKQTENELSFSQAAGTGAYKSILYRNILTNRQLIGKKITISCDIVGGTNTEIRIAKHGNGGVSSIIGTVKKDNPLTFVLTEDALPLGAFFFASQSVDPSTTINCKFSNFMIEEGETATAYVEHQEQTFTFPLAEGQRLMKGDYLADDGIHHKRKQIVLDGTETWEIRADTHEMRLDLSNYNAIYNSEILCNKLVQAKSYTGKGDKIRWILNSQKICICSENLDTANMTLDEWKQYLHENNLIIEIGIEEEIEPYTPEQQAVYDEIKKTAHSYGEQTHIFSLDEISPIFNIEYLKDTQAYIDNQITTLCNSSSSSDTIET